MKKNYLKLTIGLILITIIAVVLYGVYGLYAGNPRVQGLYLDQIAVTNDQVDLRGGSAGSADLYKDYQYSFRGEDLYIMINYALRVKDHPTADFNIRIKDDFSKIKRVYLTDGEDEKQIWEISAPATPAAVTKGAIASITQVKTPITLPADQITSGEIENGMVGGTLRYQMAPDELSAFIDYFNRRNFTEDDKINNPSDHDSLSDSTDIVLYLGDDPAICIVIIGFGDGETMVSNPDGSGYSLRDPELTDYLNVTMAGILKEKGKWN